MDSLCFLSRVLLVYYESTDPIDAWGFFYLKSLCKKA